MINFILSIQWRALLREIVFMILIVGALQFLLPRSIVKGQSMEPNLHEGERLAASPIPYLVNEPQRGDIVMLYPVEENGPSLVKRIIGLPNEQIQFQDGRVYINGVELQENYLERICITCTDGNWILGDNEYFVMGDNRRVSRDSRNYGAISGDSIMAKVLFRWWPPSQWSLFPN